MFLMLFLVRALFFYTAEKHSISKLKRQCKLRAGIFVDVWFIFVILRCLSASNYTHIHMRCFSTRSCESVCFCVLHMYFFALTAN